MVSSFNLCTLRDAKALFCFVVFCFEISVLKGRSFSSWTVRTVISPASFPVQTILTVPVAMPTHHSPVPLQMPISATVLTCLVFERAAPFRRVLVTHITEASKPTLVCYWGEGRWFLRRSSGPCNTACTTRTAGRWQRNLTLCIRCVGE